MCAPSCMCCVLVYVTYACICLSVLACVCPLFSSSVCAIAYACVQCGGKYPTRKTRWLGYTHQEGHRFSYPLKARVASFVYLFIFLVLVRQGAHFAIHAHVCTTRTRIPRALQHVHFVGASEGKPGHHFGYRQNGDNHLGPFHELGVCSRACACSSVREPVCPL